MKNSYLPEGLAVNCMENSDYLSSVQMIEKAIADGVILEATAIMCDENLNLHFDLGCAKGIMPKEESMISDEAEIKDIAILTRVGKRVCFKVKEIRRCGGEHLAILSRKQAQIEFYEKYFSILRCGDIIPARVTHLESFGAFIDIGCGISSLMLVDSISVSRISHPKERLRCGMNLWIVVKSIDKTMGRIYASQKELLGTWEDNARLFKPGQTVRGIVRSIEHYGIFVELTPNLAGLAELRDDTRADTCDLIGKQVSVYIKSIIPERMKIKLVIIDICKTEKQPEEVKYYIDLDKTRHLSRWLYSPPCAMRTVESVFED